MDLQYIEQKVSKIDRMRGDDEMAHTEEDELYAEFIELVAKSGPQELAAMAAAVLKTREIRFSRWCA